MIAEKGVAVEASVYKTSPLKPVDANDQNILSKSVLFVEEVARHVFAKHKNEVEVILANIFESLAEDFLTGDRKLGKALGGIAQKEACPAPQGQSLLACLFA